MLKRKIASARARRKLRRALPVWARAGQILTFRAELMPGRDSSERTYTVWRMLSSGRVELVGMAGQHTESEFEPSR
ncbi:MAG TPA: hypothetical protein VM911_07185 [Pyrinomonadaceae bacterium]|nr:hypothetical protein [Pyrinomonadaceae bacterium]